jgi:hypothetical protein
MRTFADLADSIRKTLTIDPAAVIEIAACRARQEHRACAAMGWHRSFLACAEWSFGLTWAEAETVRDNAIACAERAKLSPIERWARTAELHAEIAETAIPPRHAEAAQLREGAAALRSLLRAA